MSWFRRWSVLILMIIAFVVGGLLGGVWGVFIAFCLVFLVASLATDPGDGW